MFNMLILRDKKGTIQTIVLIAVVFTVVVGAGLFYYFFKIPTNTQKTQTTNNTVKNVINGTIPESDKSDESKNLALSDNCINLPENIRSCSPYKCAYFYQTNGVELTNEVFGLVDGKCHYREETRNTGMNLNCNFTTSTSQSIADFYRDLKLYDPENKTGEPIMQYKVYKVGGKEVQDPLLEVVLNGECLVEK